MSELFARPLGQLVVALAIGLVIGAERERRKAASPGLKAAGIRTFAIVGLLGGIIAQLQSTALLAVVAVGLLGLAALVYVVGERSDPGLTTEVALIATYAMGALATHDPMTALACGLGTTVLLALRTELHTLVRSLLDEREWHDALLFAIAAVVVLPLLPNRAIDPYGVINPFRLWRLVVLFMGTSAAGYIAQRALGPRYGLALAGFGSGFISSAATIATMGARAKEHEETRAAAVAGAAASNVATLIQLAILIGAADLELLDRARWPLLAGGTVTLAAAVWLTVRARRSTVAPDRGHAFKLTSALFFVGFVAVLSLVAALAERWSGTNALVITSALAGLVDAHAPSAALASVSGSGRLAHEPALLGVMLALTTNGLAKIVLSFTAGGRAFARIVVPCVLLGLGAAWLAYALWAR